jgi:hypothetical protein
VTDVGLALPAADVDRLGAEAQRYGHRVVADTSDADALAPRIAVAKPEVVIAAATAPHLSARLVAACDAHGVRLVVVGDSARERRFAAGFGVVDPVPGPPDWTLLTPGTGIPVAAPVVLPPVPVLSPRTEGPAVEETTRRPARPAVTRGRVVAVWGAAGAPGRTSLAIALAGELGADGSSVALADADKIGRAHV